MVNTPFDFNNLEKIGGKDRLCGSIDGGGKPGIDHAYVMGIDPNSNTTMYVAGKLVCEGRSMEIMTTQPTLVVYTSNYIP